MRLFSYFIFFISIMIFCVVINRAYFYTIKPFDINNIPLIKQKSPCISLLPEDPGGFIVPNQNKVIYQDIELSKTDKVDLTKKSKEKNYQVNNIVSKDELGGSNKDNLNEHNSLKATKKSLYEEVLEIIKEKQKSANELNIDKGDSLVNGANVFPSNGNVQNNLKHQGTKIDSSSDYDDIFDVIN